MSHWRSCFLYRHPAGSYNTPCHFLIADSSGKSAIIEYVDREIKVISDDGPFQVSTNFIVYGSSAPLSTGCWRYDRAYGLTLPK